MSKYEQKKFAQIDKTLVPPPTQLKPSQSSKAIPTLKKSNTIVTKKKRRTQVIGKNPNDDKLEARLSHASDLMKGNSINSLYKLAPNIGDRSN